MPKIPIPEDKIKKIIDHYFKNYYIVGELYYFNIKTWQNQYVCCSILLDYNVSFNYQNYCKIVEYGNSILAFKQTPNVIEFNYSFFDNKIKTYVNYITLVDPITSIQTMYKKIEKFFISCKIDVLKTKEF